MILPKQVYVDEAVSGTMLHRTGLDQMVADAAAGKFDVLYFYSLSRLARESVIGMPVLKALVHNHGVRIVCLQDGVDSSRAGWETIAAIFSVLHEQFIRDLSGHVRKGQQGTVLAGFSAGDWRFGYKSVPSPGGETIRRGGDVKPRRIYAIDEDQAKWVRQIFEWFVKERRTLGWIVKELNRQGVPKDHRATTTRWRRQLVAGILRSTKYIGLWSWGRLENVRNPLTGQVLQEERDEEDCRQYLREFPELRIVDDEIFQEAQRLLDQQCEEFGKYRREHGRLHGSKGIHSRPHLLRQVFRCSECQSTLIVGGGRGHYLLCPGHREGVCSCKSFLPRKLAERLILDTIGREILQNPDWREAVYQATLAAWRVCAAQNPDKLTAAKREADECDRKIRRLLDIIEESNHPDPSLSGRLKERRQERNEIDRRVRQLESALPQLPTEPTRGWVQTQLEHLGDVLRSDAPAANEALRGLLGGPIEVTTAKVPGRKRPVWRGTLRWNLSRLQQVAIKSMSDSQTVADTDEDRLDSLVLDFCKPSKLDEQVEAAWPLLQQRQTLRAIGQHLQVSEARMTVIMQHIAERYGNGRTAKELLHEFRSERRQPPAVEQYIEPAMRLYREGKLMGAIAEELGTHRDMITKAIRAGHEAQGLSAPDGRHRRKALDDKGRSSWEGRCRNTASQQSVS